MDVRFTVHGTDQLAALVDRAARMVGDLRPVWARVDRRFSRRHKTQFASAGSLTGGWPALDPDYAAWKADARGVHTDIMVKTGRLRRSLLNPFDPDAVHRITPTSYERGTAAVSESGYPYPIAHQTGRGVPKREPLVWDHEDDQFVIDEISDLLGRALNG